MRDYLEAVHSRVVVFDGGMGATLEQLDLTSEDYGGLPGKCHEALILHRPDVIQQVHESMIEAGADVLETDTFQASRLKLERVGARRAHARDQPQGGRDRARAPPASARFVAGSIGPTGFLPSSDDPTLGQIRFGELVEVFAEQARGLLEGGADLIIIETAQDILEIKAAVFGAREAFKLDRPRRCRSRSRSRSCRTAAMLLGTDIAAALATLELARRATSIGLNCSTGPEDMRDAIRYLGENSPRADALHPQRGPAAQGRRRDDLPRGARAAGGDAARVRRALRRLDRRRLLRHHAGAHRRDRRPRARAAPPSRGRSGAPRRGACPR